VCGSGVPTVTGPGTSTLLVTVENDGVGFDQAASDPSDINHGLGLIGIRERVSRIGGSLRLESAPGKGTRLTTELPVQIGAITGNQEDTTGTRISASAALHEVLGG